MTADQSPDDQVASIVKNNRPREAIVQLVEMILTLKDDYRGNTNLLYEAIGEIGDDDTVPLLIKACPYQPLASQDIIAVIVGQCGTKDAVPTLIDWCVSSKEPAT